MRVICDVYTPNGDPFPGDPRGVLKRQLERAREKGFILNTGPELEFFLLKRDNGVVEPLPHDAAGYFDLSEDLVRDFQARDIPHEVSVLRCGHYTTGKTPFKFVDGWILTRFLKKALRSH